jgi:hypothetical protein
MQSILPPSAKLFCRPVHQNADTLGDHQGGYKVQVSSAPKARCAATADQFVLCPVLLGTLLKPSLVRMYIYPLNGVIAMRTNHSAKFSAVRRQTYSLALLMVSFLPQIASSTEGSKSGLTVSEVAPRVWRLIRRALPRWMYLKRRKSFSISNLYVDCRFQSQWDPSDQLT